MTDCAQPTQEPADLAGAADVTGGSDVAGAADMGPASDVARAIAAATARLEAAGVASPRVDAELLAAHLLGVGLGELRAAAIRGAATPAGYEELIAQRAERVPLQHLTGEVEFCGVRLRVGPGVFIPRPETEQVALAARDAALRLLPDGTARIVDLCTGSGAIAAALAHWLPRAEIDAVELDPLAHGWAQQNLAGSGAAVAARAATDSGARVRLHLGDAATALPELAGLVDVVVSNPPYIPPGMAPLETEVADHDPDLALWGGGPDGLAVPRAVIATAARLLHPGGVFVMEHAESQAAAARRAVEASGAFEDIGTLPDLAGRPRMVTATRTSIDPGTP